jgi:hypothetical protein
MKSAWLADFGTVEAGEGHFEKGFFLEKNVLISTA